MIEYYTQAVVQALEGLVMGLYASGNARWPCCWGWRQWRSA